MRIVVLIKQVPDTWGDRKISLETGRIERDPSEAVIDEISEKVIEVGLQLKEQHGGEVIALTVGPEGANDVLRKALAMGADEAVHVSDEGLVGADTIATTRVLARAIEQLGFDLVIAGNESTDGRGGVIPAMLSEVLAVPHATYLDAVTVTGSTLTGERAIDAGTMTVTAELPAVISMTERSAEARYPNFRGIMAAKKKPLTVQTLSALELSAESNPLSRSTVRSVDVRPARQAGTKIFDDGTAAKQVVDFLVSNRVI